MSSEEVLCRNNGEGSSRAGRRSCALRLVRPSIPTGTSLIRLRLVRCLRHHNCVKSGNKSDFFFWLYGTGTCTVLTVSALGYCSPVPICQQVQVCFSDDLSASSTYENRYRTGTYVEKELGGPAPVFAVFALRCTDPIFLIQFYMSYYFSLCFFFLEFSLSVCTGDSWCS